MALPLTSHKMHPVRTLFEFKITYIQGKMNPRIIKSKLAGFHVAVLATDGFEESELTEPVKALKKAGAQVTILSLKPGQIQGVHHDLDKVGKVKIDRVIQDASAAEFDAVHLPGGTVNADSLRMVPEVQAFLRDIRHAGKPIAAICHAPWELVSAGLVRGRTMTSYHSIQDDINNAGGHWIDREVVEEGNWVTSRQPDDLPAFNRAMILLFSRSRRGVRHNDEQEINPAFGLRKAMSGARKDGSI